MTTEIVYSIMGNVESGAYVDSISIENGQLNITFNEKEDFDRFLNQILQENPYSPKENKEFSEMNLTDADSLEIIIPHEFLKMVDVDI